MGTGYWNPGPMSKRYTSGASRILVASFAFRPRDLKVDHLPILLG